MVPSLIDKSKNEVIPHELNQFPPLTGANPSDATVLCEDLVDGHALHDLAAPHANALGVGRTQIRGLE